MAEITIAVTAHNEEHTIAATLASLQVAIAHAECHGTDVYELIAVLDRCSDGTEAIVAGTKGVRLATVDGGLVEAQRFVAEAAGITPLSNERSGEGTDSFVIFCDADVEVHKEAVLELTVAMRTNPSIVVAYAASVPNRPARSSLLARALHTYNANDGFEVARHFFSGRCFAIRNWDVPCRQDLKHRLAGVSPDLFFRFHDGIVADDVYLSKSIAHRSGTEALLRVPTAIVRFQPAETFDGMYRYLRRMRAEIRRIDRLFPEFVRHDVPTVGRRIDWSRLAAAPRRQQLHWLVFQCAYRCCVLRYIAERYYYQYLSKDPCPLWPKVTESKALTSNA